MITQPWNPFPKVFQELELYFCLTLLHKQALAFRVAVDTWHMHPCSVSAWWEILKSM